MKKLECFVEVKSMFELNIFGISLLMDIFGEREWEKKKNKKEKDRESE